MFIVLYPSGISGEILQMVTLGPYMVLKGCEKEPLRNGKQLKRVSLRKQKVFLGWLQLSDVLGKMPQKVFRLEEVKYFPPLLSLPSVSKLDN